jgi:indolepyruvate ferredoxin oxidoreductase beta subunit
VSLPERPYTILIAALGGEGGGLMADWLMDAANAADFPAQGTSIPGVAQRTGATTYYLEIYPVRRESLGGREPVLSLTPGPGNVDLMAVSELLEAGRALHNGFVSPGRTTLVASTHRIYTTSEKMQMGDGRYDHDRIVAAAAQLARRAVLFDMRRIAEDHGTVINAVLFGAMAGSGALPLPREACEAAIRRAGRGAEASLRGFAAGYQRAAQPQTPPPRPARPELSPEEIIETGVARLTEYQGRAYAERYRERLRTLGSDDPRLVAAVARHLAVWMSYEDIIRVADLKTRAARFERIRREVRAADGEPVIVIDYLKPGVEEFASLLPPGLGRALVARAERRGRLDGHGFGMHVRTSGVLGFLMVRALAWLRPWRPYSFRYAEEQKLIERWLACVREALPRSVTLALEVAECARLLKGYGSTHRRGRANFLAILDTLSAERAGTADPDEQARAVRRARESALADPEGKALGVALGRPVTWLKRVG